MHSKKPPSTTRTASSPDIDELVIRLHQEGAQAAQHEVHRVLPSSDVEE